MRGICTAEQKLELYWIGWMTVETPANDGVPSGLTCICQSRSEVF